MWRNRGQEGVATNLDHFGGLKGVLSEAESEVMPLSSHHHMSVIAETELAQVFQLAVAKDVAILSQTLAQYPHHQVSSIPLQSHGHRKHPQFRAYSSRWQADSTLTRRGWQNKVLYAPLSEIDPEIKNIIDKETWRQYTGLELIASENLTSAATMEANGSILTNKYSEGLPNARYYGGNEYIDELEQLCRKRALEAFNLDPAKWGVNVQPYSGSTANFAALTALIQPQDRLMGLGLPDGGHLTHGYYTAKKKMTASSIYFQSFPYSIVSETGLIDYKKLDETAKIYKPRLIICGASAYPRDWEYDTLRKTADREGAWLMCDMAHTSGLVAAQELNNPFEYCDVVTTTTHKTLRGPRAGLIFFRKDLENAKDLEKRVNDAVFPACQGCGPRVEAVC
ncbi:hypothetical protein NMY22_g19353 [Coprinellus aureogranulatus]|nr:hypothetical protein NMY22_g19353 [Coprinellus aureogranulatus]